MAISYSSETITIETGASLDERISSGRTGNTDYSFDYRGVSWITVTREGTSSSSRWYRLKGTAPSSPGEDTLTIEETWTEDGEDAGYIVTVTIIVEGQDTSAGTPYFTTSSLTMEVGETATIYADANGSLAEYIDISSGNSSVVHIDEIGNESEDTAYAIISAESVGSATLYATNTETGEEGSMIVTVTGDDSGDSGGDSGGGDSGDSGDSGGGSTSNPSMSGPSTTSQLMEEYSGPLRFSISGFSDTDSLEWSTSDDDYVYISNSYWSYADVHISRNEDFKYTVTAYNSSTGESASKTVTNYRSPRSFSRPSSVRLAIGESKNISVSYSPTDVSSSPPVSYTRSSSIVSVNSRGSSTGSLKYTLVGASEGTGKITWTVYGQTIGTTEVEVYDSTKFTVEIDGPHTAYSYEDAVYTATCEETVTWSMPETYNCNGGFKANGNACTVNVYRNNSVDSDAYFIIKATYGANSDSIKVPVEEAQLSDLTISGPDEITAGTLQEYTAMPSIVAGSLDGVKYTWKRVSGSITISGSSRRACTVNAKEVDDAETAVISVTCAGMTATKEILIKYVKAEDIELSGVGEKEGYDGHIVLGVGYGTSFTAKVIPEDSNDKLQADLEDDSYYISYTQTNPYTVSLRPNGAGVAGEYVATLTAGDITKRVLVEVVTDIVEVEKVILDRTSATVKVGRTATISYSFEPPDANAGLKVSVVGEKLDIDIATITYGGGEVRVKGVSEGEISFYVEAETAKSELVTVTVVSNTTKYTVKYDGNGGTSDRTSDTVNEGGTVRLPSAVRSGWTHMGWSDGAGFVGAPMSRYTPSKSVTLKAVWGRSDTDETGTYLKVTYDGESKTMHIGEVVGIEDTYTANLSRIPTVIYGVDNRFVMDMGTVRRLNISVERVNPFPYDDSSSDDRKWSNGKWWREFEDMLDFWQNLGCDPVSHEQVGGMVFRHVPLDGELYNEIHENVFITGSITPNFTVQKMSYTIPMTVARMKESGSTVGRTLIRLVSNIPDGESVETEVWYPIGVTMPVPSVPASWDSDGYGFGSWNTQASGSGTEYEPGDRFTVPDTTLILYGQWVPPKAAIISTIPGENTLSEQLGSGITYSEDRGVRVTSSDISRVQVLIVGGGGGCGGGNDMAFGFNSAGGAGGSGDVKQMTYSVSYGQYLTYEVGKGGEGRINNDMASGDDGSDGDPSSFSIEGVRMLEAIGGDGGEGASFWIKNKVVKGGQRVCAGGSVTAYKEEGSATSEVRGANGEDGQTKEPNTIDNVGKGVKSRDSTIDYHAGGAGGGAAALNHTIRVGTTKRTFTSKGGNGTWNGPGKDGVLGGGGGSGSGDTELDDNGNPPGCGGDGLVVMVFY